MHPLPRPASCTHLSITVIQCETIFKRRPSCKTSARCPPRLLSPPPRPYSFAFDLNLHTTPAPSASALPFFAHCRLSPLHDFPLARAYTRTYGTRTHPGASSRDSCELCPDGFSSHGGSHECELQLVNSRRWLAIYLAVGASTLTGICVTYYTWQKKGERRNSSIVCTSAGCLLRFGACFDSSVRTVLVLSRFSMIQHVTRLKNAPRKLTLYNIDFRHKESRCVVRTSSLPFYEEIVWDFGAREGRLTANDD